jgi:hypothetical protein
MVWAHRAARKFTTILLAIGLAGCFSLEDGVLSNDTKLARPFRAEETLFKLEPLGNQADNRAQDFVRAYRDLLILSVANDNYVAIAAPGGKLESSAPPKKAYLLKFIDLARDEFFALATELTWKEDKKEYEPEPFGIHPLFVHRYDKDFVIHFTADETFVQEARAGVTKPSVQPPSSNPFADIARESERIKQEGKPNSDASKESKSLVLKSIDDIRKISASLKATRYTSADTIFAKHVR